VRPQLESPSPQVGNLAPAPLDLAQLRAWCEQSRPIFIVGLARAGTSILQVAFAHQPTMFDIANCRETFIFLRPRHPFAEPIHLPTRSYLKGRPNLMTLREWIRSYEQKHGELSEADAIRAFFYFAGNLVYPGRHPLEKTPGHLRKLDLIFDIFPQAHILVCSRDPVDVTASYRKRWAAEQGKELKSGTSMEWLRKHENMDEMIAVFERFTKLVKAYAPKYGSRMYMAPYSWLIESPEEAFRAICAWAGVEFVPEMVAADTGGVRASGQAAKGHAIQSRASDAQKVLTAEEIEKIRGACTPWLELWNKPGVLG
jgi:hypothetical protein